VNRLPQKMWGAWLSATNSAAVYGCASLTLSDNERRFFRDADPLGFILFARNVEEPDQVRALVADLRDCVGRSAPVLIDQEGGRVQRLRPPHWRSAPPMRVFGDAYKRNPDAALEAVRKNMQAIGVELADLGIDVDCAPCLDVPIPGAHDIIGNRALSEDPEVVSALAEAACQGLIDAGVVPVIKHLPGHGRALVDSHEKLPEVTDSEQDMGLHDLLPFKAVAKMPVAAMTAHVVYTAYAEGEVATLSHTVISRVIRSEIGFHGLLFSDDLGMKALSGSFTERAETCLAAGCDVALHCSGDLEEMQQVAAGVTPLSDHAVSALEDLNRFRGRPQVEIDFKTAAFQVAELLETAA
jgi:beta-N-acetylhexosaminidase